jgi:hypothetical protein
MSGWGAAGLTRREQTSRGGTRWYEDKDTAEIEDKAVQGGLVRAGEVAVKAAWAAKGSDQVENAFAPSVDSGPLINGVSHATNRCVPRAIHR